MRFITAFLFFLFSAVAAHAACETPPDSSNGDIRFFLGIEPSDGILDIWCRLQGLPAGEYEIKLLFPNKDINAHRTFKVTFDGAPTQDKIEFATMLQSLFPTERGRARDENNMNFGLVLERAVQALSPEAPDGQLLGIPAAYPQSRAISIWEPITIRVRPITIAGAAFYLEINMRPSAARLIMALNGQVEDLIVNGWHENLFPGPQRVPCPANIPDCAQLPELVELHTPWVVGDVTLYSEGKGLSAAAIAILGQIEADNRHLIRNTVMDDFSPTVGQARFDVETKSREILARADGDPLRTAGTQKIRIRWRERSGSKTTYAFALQQYANDAREAMVLAASSAQ